ncbi:hypothetical protein [Roseibium sp.]|uniref:hypothetical protein n=1 Tax=Roseibium sp. TaxID=1936156 RepID=UPI003BAFA663
MSDKLAALVDQVRDYKMTAEEFAEQRIAYAYGNAPLDDDSMKEQVRQALTVPFFNRDS